MFLLSQFKQCLESEYQNLPIFYFLCFMSGIIYYFTILQAMPNILETTICVLLCALFILITSTPLRQDNIILHFILYTTIAFAGGVAISKIHMMNKNHPMLKRSIITELSGQIASIKPTLHGTQIILHNTNIPSQYKRNYTDINKVKINISKKFRSNNNEELEIGDIISLKAKIMPPQGSVLPGTFDFAFYMHIDGIQASGYALTPCIIKEKVKKSYFASCIDNTRLAIYKIFTHNMDVVNVSNILAAILLGYTKSIPTTILNDIRNSGIAHILCVSGLHLSLVAMICFITSRALLNCSNIIAYNLNIKIIAALISICGSFMYLLLSGANIAAIRAFIMTAVIITAIMTGKSPHPLRSLALAAFIVLIISPSYVFHPSFQLSFIAVLCLISGYNFYQKYQYILGKRGGIFSSIKFYIFTNLYTTIIASFATTPFVIYHFYKIPTYTLIMNLIAVPLMSFCIMPLGIMALLLIPLHLYGQILNLLSFFINIIINSSHYITSLPASVIHTGHITPTSLMIFTTGFIWNCIWQTKIKYFGVVLIIISIIAMMATPKPDLIYDFEHNLMGIKNYDGNLEIYYIVNNKQNNQPHQFLLNYWTSWYGQKEVIYKRISTNKSNIVATKHKVTLVYCSDIWSKWVAKQCRVTTLY